jgi:putative endonuclease
MLTVAQAFGALGERVAEHWVTGRGWTVLERRYRAGRRDLDLVMRRGQTVAFVEVKTRRGDGFGDPVSAVNGWKQRQLVRSAEVWIARHGEPGLEYRFDVIGILVDEHGPRVEHLENAFTR